MFICFAVVVDCGFLVVMMRFTLLFFCLGLLVHSATGQPAGPDSSALAARQAVTRYEQARNSPERLYNGPEYIGYDRRLNGHAFFPADSMQAGRVAYEGGVFSVPLLYDIVSDVVLVVHTSGYRLALHSDRLRQFSVANHQFIRLDSNQQAMPAGFYDLLYNGPTQLLARRTKVIMPTSSNSGGFGLYDPRTTYYIRKNGLYVPVKTRRALLRLLGDRRKQLATYARRQQLRFRPSPETALLKLTQHYDELTRSL